MISYLLLTDFSFGATKALDYAVRLAKRNQARLVILHVCELAGYGLFDLDTRLESFNDERVVRLSHQLKLMRTSIETAEGVPVVTRLYNGNYLASISEIIRQEEIALVITGTIGEGHQFHGVIGNRASQLIRQSAIPVLAVPPEYEALDYGRIILSLKEDDPMEEVVGSINRFMDLSDTVLDIIVCSEEREEAYEVIEDTRVLHHAVDQIKRWYPALQVEWNHLGGKKFETSFFEHLKDHPCDMVVMVSHHHRWIEYFTGKSTTQRIVMHLFMPLLVVPGH